MNDEWMLSEKCRKEFLKIKNKNSILHMEWSFLPFNVSDIKYFFLSDCEIFWSKKNNCVSEPSLIKLYTSVSHYFKDVVPVESSLYSVCSMNKAVYAEYISSLKPMVFWKTWLTDLHVATKGATVIILIGKTVQRCLDNFLDTKISFSRVIRCNNFNSYKILPLQVVTPDSDFRWIY